MSRPSVIAIGYGTHLFDAANPERVRLALCATETAALHQITFTHRKHKLLAQSDPSGLHVHPTNSRHKLLMVFDAIMIARRLIKESDQDLIVTVQDPFATGLAGLILKKLYGVRLVVQEHGDVFGTDHWQKESLFNRAAYQVGVRILRQADAVRVVAKRVALHVAKVGVSVDKIVYLSVAIETEKFTPKEHQSKSIASEPFHFLTVARLVKQKNFPLMLRAFKKAWEENNQLRLTIVGKGPELETIKDVLSLQYVSSESPVVLQAWSDDVPSLMRDADAYLLTSNYEGWARVLIEAMVTHLPVVTTDVGCVGEVLLDGTHGLIAPLEDEQALVAAMYKLSTDADLYAQIATNLQSLVLADIPGADTANYGKKWVETLIT